jgi:hypothetical protein
VTLSLANHDASLPVAYRLYLPEDWAKDEVRRHKAKIPETIAFQSKPEIALEQLKAARAAGLPQGVVLMDAGYGSSAIIRSSNRSSALVIMRVARLPPSRHTLHRRLRLPDRRTSRHPPLRTSFRPAALAICPSPGLPTQRRRRSDPNATFQIRSPPCRDASSPPSPDPSRDALAAMRRSARRPEFPITDAVRLRA